jgi:hypothetical protein
MIAMARGWESKAVEEQLGAIEAEKEARTKKKLTTAELERRAQKEGLQFSRTRIMKDLEAARDERYRALLERTLAHLDAELAKFDSGDSLS